MASPYKRLESYTDKPYVTPNTPHDFMRREDRNASLNDITTYIYQSLLDFQGKWYPSDRGTGYISMPNARYLAIGDKITNITKNVTYVISQVILPQGTVVVGSGGAVVGLNTMGSPLPVEDDILVLEDRNTVNFQSSYSRYLQQEPIAQWRDTIVYRVKRREPGTVGKHAFEPPVELKPRVRESKMDKDHPGSSVQVMGQWFDNIIQFDCWSVFNNRADDLIEWFEDFMFKYTWVWKKNGVNEILYWMRNEDTESSEWRNDLAVRNVNYYFRTEKIVTIKEHDFKQISIYLELGLPYPSGYYSNGPVNIDPNPQPSGFIQVSDQGLQNV